MAICAECTYLDIDNGHNSGKFLCRKSYERHYGTDPECNKFCRAYSRDIGTIDNIKKLATPYTTDSGCYLTTMLCNILSLPDNNVYLETIRNFRKNILQKDEKYKSILVEYDIIGPVIANALQNDPLNEAIAKIYLNNFIIPITGLIKENRNEEAINKYYQMTNNLKTFYGFSNYNISIEQLENADIEKSGHGKYIQKKITL